MRPRDDDDEQGHSSDAVSDEWLEVSHTRLADALETKVDRRRGKDEDAEGENDPLKAGSHLVKQSPMMPGRCQTGPTPR